MSIPATWRMGAAAAAVVLLNGSIVLAQEINVYSSRHYDTDLALYDRFTEETGVEINLIEGDSDELIERIRSEGVNSPADVLITVDAGRLWRAAEADLFQPVESEVLEERVPESLRHPDGLWFGLSKRARVVVYDREQGLPDGLETYEDLADPAYRGMVCSRSSSNIYSQSLLASVIANVGEEEAEAWAEGVVANFAREPEGNDTAQITAVAAGECRLAIVNTYYVGRLLASDEAADREVGESIGILFPSQDGRGTHVNISGAGVLRNAPNAEAATRFIEYLTSPEAQTLFAEGNNEYPVVEDVPVEGPIAAFGAFKADTVNASLLGEYNPAAVRVFDRVGWK
ncbi:MAG: Fe(3+) ABC transporter substrate-binding protein [Inquilinaceae bacterium]